jgi:hypothetical protein
MSDSRLQMIFSLVLLAACNRYEHFNVAGYEQASFDNEADVLFVIDNSPSMSEETASLALNFNIFITTLTSTEDGAEQITETLSDAVGNYVDYTQQRGRFLDYNLAITTTSADYSSGETDGIDPGEAGTFLGDPTVLSKGDDDVDELFEANLLCEAAYWSDAAVPSDPSYECGDDPQGVITQEYLDCTCGFNGWDNAAGSGDEEPLESALNALCRAVDDPPEVCFNELSPFAESQTWTNDGFYREKGTVVVVIVSDEGDSSRKLAQGDEDPLVYLEAFADFSKPVKFVGIGPQWDGSSVSCVDTSVPTWSVERVETMAIETGGYYSSISDENCEPADFAEELRKLGVLLQASSN